MDYPTTQLILNKNKRIGKVLFIVEGKSTEPFLLCQIFEKIFGYHYTRIYGKGRKTYEKLCSNNDRYSQVFVVNAEESNIKHISDKNQYLDSVFASLKEEYGINFENMAIFYIWDRDNQSNTDTQLLSNLLNVLSNARDSVEHGFERQGLLLISYPAVEAYIATNFIENCFDSRFTTGHELKQYLHTKKINQKNIDSHSIVQAVLQLLGSLNKIGVEEFDIDNMQPTNQIVFQYQEKDSHTHQSYRLLSMLSIALLDLGLIISSNENNFKNNF